jgi:hypothetical protein
VVGAVSIGSFEGSRFVRGGRYGISIDFGLEVVEKENACWEIFKSKFVDLTMKRKLTIRLIVTRDGQFFKTAGLEPLMPLGSGTRQRPPQSGLVQTPQGLRMLLGAFRGGNPLERIVAKPYKFANGRLAPNPACGRRRVRDRLDGRRQEMTPKGVQEGPTHRVHPY